MKKSFLLLLIFFISVVSVTTFFMILNYLDPYSNKILAVIFLATSFFIGVSTSLSLIIYFIKKIHYRGNVEIYHIKTSFRQAYLIAVFFLGVFVFKVLGGPIYLLTFLLFIILIFLELFIRNLEN